jgi:hypothetical protein
MTSVAELSRQVEEEKVDLGRNLAELKDRADAALDWREQVRRHPALVAAGALGAGMLLAQMGRGRSRRHAPIGSAVMSNGQEPASHGPGVLDIVGDSLKATVATAVAGMLAEFIPGFREEHEKRRR